MSRETLNWLNENTLIGFTERRGHAWHYRQGADNHYVGGVPVDDVRKRLFNWHAEEHPILVGETVTPNLDISPPRGSVVLPGPVVPGYKAWVHPKTGEVLGVHKATRALHQYDEWLLDTTSLILDDTLQIGSAGLLRGGRIAWVQVEVPEEIVTPEGVKFRPFILARSSMDGSVATTFSRSITNTVCDNTMAIAATEHGGQRVVFRATGNSDVKLADAREALGIIYTAADDFAAQVAALTATPFTPRAFESLAEVVVPGEKPELTADKRAVTHWQKVQEKRTYLSDLYRFDERVAPWTGTAFGAWQAFNTYDQHERKVRGANRVERNQLQVVKGQQDRQDAKILETITELAVS
jgi:phage/plasmid-like protein (TIGR03299 family)